MKKRKERIIVDIFDKSLNIRNRLKKEIKRERELARRLFNIVKKTFIILLLFVLVIENGFIIFYLKSDQFVTTKQLDESLMKAITFGAFNVSGEYQELIGRIKWTF